MPAKCTWQFCKSEARKPQLDRDGKQWANLCPTHDTELEASFGDPRKILRAWVTAQGGPKAAAARM